MIVVGCKRSGVRCKEFVLQGTERNKCVVEGLAGVTVGMWPQPWMGGFTGKLQANNRRVVTHTVVWG